MGGSACFQLPTAPLSTRDGTPSNLGCGPIVPAATTAPLTISGVMATYGANKPVGGGEVKLYSSPDYATPYATTTAAADGTYSIELPAGTPDVLFGEYTAAGYLVVYPHAQRPNLTQGNITDFKLALATPDNVESAALLVKEIWDPAATVIAGTLLDCQRLVVMHGIVVLSTTSGTRSFAPRASIYYSAPGAVPLVAPPDERWDTNDNGAFAAFHIQPTQSTMYLQAWGFVDAAAQAQGEAGLTLIAEQPVHIVVNTFDNVALWTR